MYLAGICYTPLAKSEFLNYDDNLYIAQNQPLIKGDISTLFSEYYANQYAPLAMTIMSVEAKIFGMDAAKLKILSVILHLLCAFLIYYFLNLLLNRQKLAVIVAMLFVLHPLHTESVSWLAASMKIVPYAIFFMLGLISYTSYVTNKKKSNYILALVFMLCAAFCKEQAVVFPIALFIIDYIKDRHEPIKKILIEKIPFFMLAIVFGIITLNMTKNMQGDATSIDFSFFDRLIFAGWAVTHYVTASLIPIQLSGFYTYPEPSHIPVYYYIGPLVALSLVCWCIRAYKRQQKIIAAGIAFFLVNIALTSTTTLMQVRDVIMADRYAYLALIGLLLVLVHVVLQLIERKPALKNMLITGIGIYAIVLAYLTFDQSKIWINSETLFSDVVSKEERKDGSKNSFLALPYNNLGIAQKQKGNYTSAMANYNRAIESNVNYAKAWMNRGNVYLDQNENQKALADYDKGIELDPDNAVVWSNRGTVYARLNQMDQSILDYNHALELNPNYADAIANRGFVYYSMGDFDSAVTDLNRYFQFRPNDHSRINLKALALQQLGRYDEAKLAYDQSIQLDPRNGLYYLNRSKFNYGLGRMDQAKNDARQAQQLGTSVEPEFLQRLQ